MVTSIWPRQIPRYAKRLGWIREKLSIKFGSDSAVDISFKNHPREFKVVTNFIGDVLCHAPVNSNISLGRFGSYETQSVEGIRKLGEMFQNYDVPPLITFGVFSFKVPFFKPFFPVDDINAIINGGHQLYELWISTPSPLLGFDFYAEYMRGSRTPTDLRFRVFDGGKLTVDTGKLTRIGEFNIQLEAKNTVIICDFTQFSTESNTYESFK